MPNANASNQLAGIALLFVVKLASVASAEISRHLFHDLEFKRPFLVTYIKYCMFSVFLIRYAMSGSSSTRAPATGESNYAKLESTISDEEYEVENLTAAEFESLTSDVESVDELDNVQAALDSLSNSAERPPDSGCGNVAIAPLVEIHVDDNGNGGRDDDDGRRRPPINERQPSDGKRIRRVRFALMREVRAFPARIQRDAKLARLSYRPKIAHWTCRCQQFTRSASALFVSTNDETFGCFFFLAPSCFLSALTFHIALVFASVTLTNLIALSYAAFLILIGLACGRRVSVSAERCTLLKLGSFIALTSALAHAGYLAAFAGVSTKYARLEMSYVLGTFGLFAVTVCTPLLAFLHAYGYESQTPAPTLHQWTLIVASGFLGGIVVEALWLRATALVSTPTALLSTALSVMFSAVCDYVVRGESPTLVEIFASVPITALFVGTSLLAVPGLNSSLNNGQQPPADKFSADADHQLRSNYNRRRRGGPSLGFTSFCNRCFGVRMVDLEDASIDNDGGGVLSSGGYDTDQTTIARDGDEDEAATNGWSSSSSSSSVRDPMRVMMEDSMESVRLMSAVNEE